MKVGLVLQRKNKEVREEEIWVFRKGKKRGERDGGKKEKEVGEV